MLNDNTRYYVKTRLVSYDVSVNCYFVQIQNFKNQKEVDERRVEQ